MVNVNGVLHYITGRMRAYHWEVGFSAQNASVTRERVFVHYVIFQNILLSIPDEHHSAFFIISS